MFCLEHNCGGQKLQSEGFKKCRTDYSKHIFFLFITLSIFQVMLGISILFTFILGVMLVAIAKGVGRQEYFNSVIAVVSGLLTTWDVLVAGMGIKVAAT